MRFFDAIFLVSSAYKFLMWRARKVEQLGRGEQELYWSAEKKVIHKKTPIEPILARLERACQQGRLADDRRPQLKRALGQKSDEKPFPRG